MALRDVKGQESALRVLRGAMKRDRMATSYLFSGEEGIGKRFTAVNLAKALNCKSPVDGDACEECASCKKINAGTHIDFRVVEPDGEQIKVEQIREIEEALSLKPYEGGMKVVVVDDAEQMNTYAANAFLKTLEEPAPQSLIILVSSNPDWLPMTIRSRCSRVNFTPLSPEACGEVIRETLGTKKSGEVDALVRFSMGRPGLVLREDPVKARDKFMGALVKMLQREGRCAWKERGDMKRWIEMAMTMLRDMAVLSITGDAEGLLNEDIAPELKRMSKGATTDSIVQCYGKLMGIAEDLRFNPNKAVTWNYAGSVLEAAGISG